MGDAGRVKGMHVITGQFKPQAGAPVKGHLVRMLERQRKHKICEEKKKKKTKFAVQVALSSFKSSFTVQEIRTLHLRVIHSCQINLTRCETEPLLGRLRKGTLKASWSRTSYHSFEVFWRSLLAGLLHMRYATKQNGLLLNHSLFAAQVVRPAAGDRVSNA